MLATGHYAEAFISSSVGLPPEFRICVILNDIWLVLMKRIKGGNFEEVIQYRDWKSL